MSPTPDQLVARDVVTQLRAAGDDDSLAAAAKIENELDDRRLTDDPEARAAVVSSLRERAGRTSGEDADRLNAEADRVEGLGDDDDRDPRFASRAAQDAADDADLDPDEIQGSGAEGRITLADVRKAAD